MAVAATETRLRRRILIIAGEASGDLLGAELTERIHDLAPGCEIFGLAGPRMRAAGVRALVNLESVAAMGATELASTIGPVLNAFRKLVSTVRREPPDLVILIDFADFNLKFAWFARRAGTRVLYYVPPQVWAWRRWRIKTLVRRTDQIAVVFPFETELFEKAGGRVSFVGHPLLDRLASVGDRKATLAGHRLPPDARILAIMPGSRRAEIRYLLRPMLDAARVLCADHDLVPVIIRASTVTGGDLGDAAGSKGLSGVHIIDRDSYSIIAASELALVASGTATIETALLGCPMVIAYRMSRFSYALGRMLVRGVEHVGMPNLLAGRQLVPELIQHEVTPANLIRAAEPLLQPAMRDQLVGELRALRDQLGTPGAAARVAAIALEMIE